MTDVRERAQTLRAGGASYPTISAALGVPYATLYAWLNAEYAQRQREKSIDAKRRRHGTCERCGAPTNYNGKNGKGVSTFCATCGPIISTLRNRQRAGTGPVQVALLAFADRPRNYVEIRDHLGIPNSQMGPTLDRLLKQGRIRRVSRGVYVAVETEKAAA